MSLVSPLLVKRLIDEAIPAADVALIVPLLIGIIAFPLLTMALGAVQNYLRASIGEAVSQSLRQTLFNHTLRAKLHDLERVTSGRIIRAITKVCGEVGEVYVSNELLPVFTNAVLLLGTLGVMFFLNSRLLLVSLIIFPISYLFARPDAAPRGGYRPGTPSEPRLRHGLSPRGRSRHAYRTRPNCHAL